MSHIPMREPLPEARRRAYLQAMGVDVWLTRSTGDGRQELSPVPQPRSPSSVARDDLSKTQGNSSDISDESGQTQRWALLKNEVMRCTLCRLHETRTQAVFGVGDTNARLMIIGEAPGGDEDRVGEPFVGAAGKMLTAMLQAIGITRDTVFIANVLKCRPPQNRDPRGDEMAACQPYLRRQIEAVAPDIILAVGRIAAQQLLGQDKPLGRLRGADHQLPDSTIPLVVTYHPAYLLRTPAQKALAWQDLKRVKRHLELTQ